MPSLTFIVAIVGTQIIAGIICLVGPKSLGAVPIGWAWTWIVLTISALMFMVLDVVKVYTFKFWSFELTAHLWPTKENKEKLQKRTVEKEVEGRVSVNIQKARKAFTVVRAKNAFTYVGRVSQWKREGKEGVPSYAAAVGDARRNEKEAVVAVDEKSG